MNTAGLPQMYSLSLYLPHCTKFQQEMYQWYFASLTIQDIWIFTVP